MNQLYDILSKMSNGNLDTKQSICGNVYRLGGGKVSSMKLYNLFPSWSKFSDSAMFPVPASSPVIIATNREEYRSCAQYIQCRRAQNFWAGEQGVLRRELLMHVMQELKNES